MNNLIDFFDCFSLGYLNLSKNGKILLNENASLYLGHSSTNAEISSLLDQLHPGDFSSIQSSCFYRYSQGDFTSYALETIEFRVIENNRVRKIRVKSVADEVSMSALIEEELPSTASPKTQTGLQPDILHEAKNIVASLRLFLEKKNRDNNENTQPTKNDLQFLLSLVLKLNVILSSAPHLPVQNESRLLMTVKFQEIISEVLETVREQLRDKEINLILWIPPELEIKCQPVKIFQLFLNLILNAADAISNITEKWIEISAKTDGQFTRISVKDSGRGIYGKNLEKIFTPHYSTKGNGRGIGLAVSKKIAIEHSGDLIYNHTSPNTEFVLFLPAHQDK